MDPMESMANTAGPIPKDFNADEAANMEDVRPPFCRSTAPKQRN